MSVINLFYLLTTAILIQYQNVMASSGCELCASTGQCGQAFHYGPGQFCGTFHKDYVTVQPCCCPMNTQCQLSSNQCNCYVPNNGRSSSSDHNSGYHRGYDYNHYDHGGSSIGSASSIGGFIFFIVVCCFCCACCNAFSRASNQDLSGEFHRVPVPVAVPVSDDNGGDFSGNPPPTAPSYQRSTPNTTNGGGGGGIGLSALAGLGGFILGEQLGNRRGHRHHHHGGGGFGGGFSMPGDTGGGGGFTIRGDS